MRIPVKLSANFWLKRWAELTGVENPDITVQHVERDRDGYALGDPYAVTIRFMDHGEDRSAMLFPRDIADVIYSNSCWNSRDFHDVKFDGQCNLTFKVRGKK